MIPLLEESLYLLFSLESDGGLRITPTLVVVVSLIEKGLTIGLRLRTTTAPTVPRQFERRRGTVFPNLTPACPAWTEQVRGVKLVSCMRFGRYVLVMLVGRRRRGSRLGSV